MTGKRPFCDAVASLPRAMRIDQTASVKDPTCRSAIMPLEFMQRLAALVPRPRLRPTNTRKPYFHQTLMRPIAIDSLAGSAIH